MTTHFELDPGQMKAVASTEERLVVRATPGAGKTVILQEIARAHAGERILYITFSKAMADEAKTRLPPDVEAMTFHAMTYRALRSSYGHKFKGSEVTPHEVGKLFDIPPEQMEIVYLAMAGLSQFLYGDSEVPGMMHLPPACEDYGSGDRMKILQLMRKIWARMIDPNDAMPLSHDSGAKLFQTRMYSVPYDVILFDEYQDASVCMLKTLDQQSARIVMVGDPFQSIHKYRGAVGDLNGHFRADAIVQLRRSYRFGEFIAQAAKAIINTPGQPEIQIMGVSEEPGLVISPDMDPLDVAGRRTTLFRTNAGLFEYLDDYLIDNPGGKISLIGGSSGYSTHDLLQMFNFVSGNHRWVKDPFLLTFRNSRELEDHANAHGLNDVLSRLRLVRRYGKDFPLLLRRIEAACVSNPAQADIHAGNVHKAKGQEFDVVALGEDFPSIWNREGCLIEEERNVLYVAATRAKRILLINRQLDELYTDALLAAGDR